MVSIVNKIIWFYPIHFCLIKSMINLNNTGGVQMSISEYILKALEMLGEEERQKLLEIIKDKYMSKDVILLSKSYDWWNNEEDDIYNER